MRFDLKISPPDRVDAMIRFGCPIVFTAFPGLSASYPIDANFLATLGTLARDAACGFGLPSGTLTYPITDLVGTRHLLTGAQIRALYTRLRDYRHAMALYALRLSATLPSAQPPI